MKTNLLHFLSVLGIFMLNACVKQDKNTVEKPEEVIVETPKIPIYDTDDPKTVLASVAYSHGGWDDLWKKRDVQYTYDYRYPANGKADISTERYIFDSEISYGHYTLHQINVMPDQEGEVFQYFDGKKTVVLANGKKIEDPEVLASGDFLRRANYFWFVMPYKLNENGTIASYEGQEAYHGKHYDKIKISYDPEVTGKEQNDSYMLYIDPVTKLIDRFYFSLPFLGVHEPVIIADYEYSDVDGQKIATKRSYYIPNEQGYSKEPNLVQTLTNITFNNGFTREHIMKTP
ncbi:MAG: DUF6503 family protein [Bacteroidota bacterium]